ncbi:MAG: ATP-binding protein, partial [Candidatus Muiribacteriaceae bacterium]
IQRFNIIYMISGAPYFLFGELSESIYTIHLILYSLACLFFLYIFQLVSKNNNIVRGNNTILSLSFILLSSMYMGEFFSSFYLDDLRYIAGFRFFFYVVATIITLLSVHNFILFRKKGDMRGLIKSLIYLFGLLGVLITGNIIIDRVISYNRDEISIELSEKLENHKDIFINRLNKYSQTVELLAGSQQVIDFFGKRSLAGREEVEETLVRYRESFDASLVYLLDLDGNVLASVESEGEKSLTGKNYSFRPYFKEARQGRHFKYFAVGVTTGKRGYYVSAPVISDGSITGVAVMKKNVYDFSEFLSEKKSPSFLVDSNNIIFMTNLVPENDFLFNYLFYPDEHEGLMDKHQFALVREKEIFSGDRNGTFHLDNSEFVMKKALIDDTGFYMCIFDSTDILSDYRMIGIFMLLSFCGMILVFYYSYITEDTFMQTIKASEKKYRMLFENSPNMIALLDHDFRFGEYNRKFEWLAGESIKKEPKKDIFCFFDDFTADRASVLKKNILDGKTLIREVLFIIDQGDTRNMLIMLSAIDNNHVIFIGVDITDERKMEEALFTEKEKLLVTINAIREGMISVNEKGKVILVNPEACRLLELDREDIEGNDLSRTIVLEKDGNRIDPVKDVVKNKTTVDMGRGVFLNGNIPVALTAAPIFDNAHSFSGVVLTIRDISREMKVEEEMVNIQKLESIGLFAAGIAHDFNNIMTSIMGNISIALHSAVKDSRSEKMLINAQNACRNAKDLTMQLLTFAKTERPDKTLVNAGRMILETSEFSIRGSQCELDIRIDDDLWDVEVEEGKISQVISNIIINAYQAMHDEGVVRVRAENFVQTGNNSQIAEGEYIRISISDTGEGIDRDDLNRIFDPYFTTKPEGTGLGLATVLAIVKKHDGFIKVNSQKGEGTEFLIFLPAVIRGEGNARVDESMEEASIIDDGGKALIMDDESDVRDVITMMLEDMGYSVDNVSDGDELLSLYREGRRYDIVVMDLTIRGGRGGLDTIEELRGIDPGVTTLVSSGYSRNQIMENYHEYGFSGYISKPFTINELSEAIRKIKSER